MPKCNTAQLIAPEVMEYLTKRQIALVVNQHDFEEMRDQYGTDDESILFSIEDINDMVKDTQARRNELALMVISLEKTETDKRQNDLDAFEDSLIADDHDQDHGTFIVEVGTDRRTPDVEEGIDIDWPPQGPRS